MPVASRTAPRSARRWRTGARRPTGPRRAVPLGSAPHRTSSPISPPSQIEPETRWSQSSDKRQTAWRGLGGMARGAGNDKDGGRRRHRADRGEELGDRAVLAFGAVEPERDRGRNDEQREAELQVDVAAAEGGHPVERHERSDVEKRAQRVDPRRHVEVDGDREQPESRARPRTRPRSPAGSSPAPGGPRDGRSQQRSTKRPIALITTGTRPAGDDQRGRGRGLGDVRNRELRCRPGFGPTAKVNAPCTGWPSTEIARQ